MKFGYVVELDTTNMSMKISKCLTGFIKSYSTTHFLMNEMSCNLQDTLGVLCLTFLQNLKEF